MADQHHQSGDMEAGGWIDRYAPGPVRPYLRLMRLDRPIGVWLLLLPCWWGLALAGAGMDEARLFVLFAIGAVIMRGAGLSGPRRWAAPRRFRHRTAAAVQDSSCRAAI